MYIYIYICSKYLSFKNFDILYQHHTYDSSYKNVEKYYDVSVNCQEKYIGRLMCTNIE